MPETPATAKPFDFAIIKLDPNGRPIEATYHGANGEAPTMPPAELFDGAKGPRDVIDRMMSHQDEVMAAKAAAEAEANKPAE